MDIAVVGAAAWVKLSADGTTIEQARIGLAAVAPTPLFAAEASQGLIGKAATEETFAQAGELARKVAAPISDMRGTAEFRLHLVGVLTRRTLAKAVERARAEP
jgi:carbon-monoxide dehydrogenase medium subunit